MNYYGKSYIYAPVFYTTAFNMYIYYIYIDMYTEYVYTYIIIR